MVSLAALATRIGGRHERCHHQRLEQHNRRPPSYAAHPFTDHLDPVGPAQEGTAHHPWLPDELDHDPRISQHGARR